MDPIKVKRYHRFVNTDLEGWTIEGEGIPHLVFGNIEDATEVAREYGTRLGASVEIDPSPIY